MNQILKFAVIAALPLLLILTLYSSAVASEKAEPAIPAEQSTKANTLISQIVEAYGGRESLAKVRNIYSRSYHKIYQADNDGWITRYLQRPGKFRVETALHQATGTRQLAGDRVWMGSGKEPLKEADTQTREWIVFLFNSQDLPFSLAEGKWTLVPGEKEKNGNARVEVLIMKNSSGLELTLEIGAKSHLITKVTGAITKGKERITISQEYQDFREVNGIKIPYRIINHYDNKPYAVSTLAEVKINKEMTDQLFLP